MSKLLDKIWLFYADTEGYGKYHIYAMTNQKEYAKQFMEERDMKKFKVKKFEDDHDTWKEMAKECGDAVLDFHYLQTRKETKNNTYTTIQVPILCTMYESQSADSDFMMLDVMSEGFWIKMPSHISFTNKLRKYLEILEYDDMFKLFAPFKVGGELTDDDPDYSAPSTEVDEVGLLIKTFYNLFKK